MKTSSTAFRTRLSPLLPAVMLAASGCIYAVQPAPAPEMTPAASRLPLSVGIIDRTEPDRRAASKRALNTPLTGLFPDPAKPDRQVMSTPAEAFASALLRTGLFRDVRGASGGAGGFDLAVELSGKQDRTMHAFFPFFLPFCDPLIIGCLPFYPLSEHFTAEMHAQVSGGKSYVETGESTLHCTGVLGCVPASQGDPDARASAMENAAAKLAADFLKDASFYRDLARSAATRQSGVSEESARAESEAAAPSNAPAAPTAPASGQQKPWWQN